MFSEFAVEPGAISSDWHTCRYLAEKFGFDRGRLLSLYPKRWLPEAIAAADHLQDLEKKRVIEKLVELKRTSSIRLGRAYDPAMGGWLNNALAQHATEPFRAIIASSNPGSNNCVLGVDEVEETHPLFSAPHDAAVVRDAAVLAGAMALLLRSAQRVLFVDGYYDPFNARYQSTLRNCMKLVHIGNPGASCEIHHLDYGKCPPPAAIIKEAEYKFAGVIPDGVALTIFRWRERNGGADFHGRYVLTDRGGVGIDAGFSAEGGHQTTDMHLMSFALSQEKINALARDATVYELVEPVLRITADGRGEQV